MPVENQNYWTRNTYSLTNYNEAEKVVSDYNELAKKAQEINNQLKPEYKDAYYQLVLFPVLASANLNELYLATAKIICMPIKEELQQMIMPKR